jgi:pimeloyl-ACP methyl ester carboxylesterase
VTPHVAPHVIFSHGKDSEPWGRKILALAETARAAGCSVDSVDYRGIDEVERRLEKLLITGREGKPAPVLVGSSLGAWLSLAAAERLAARALFLMAPAVGLEPLLPPLPILPAIEACPTVIVHGWRDEIVPCDNALRFAAERRATLHVVDDDHRLHASTPRLQRWLTDLLGSLT